AGLLEGRPGTRIEEVDRDRLDPEIAQGKGEIDPVGAFFAETENAAATRLHAGIARRPHGFCAILEGKRAADLGEEPLRRLEVVVVAADTGLREALRLARLQQAK